VDGTVLEARASHKSFKPKDRDPSEPPPAGRNSEKNLHGGKRSNQTHESTTNPEARLHRKSQAAPAKMAYLGHLLMEHRNGLIVDMELTQGDGHGERAAAVAMIERLPKRRRRRTVEADTADDPADFVTDCATEVSRPVSPSTPTGEGSAIDRRTPSRGSRRVDAIRNRIEEPSAGPRPAPGAASSVTTADNATGPGGCSPAPSTTSSVRMTALDTTTA
jgi:hypothetical protein